MGFLFSKPQAEEPKPQPQEKKPEATKPTESVQVEQQPKPTGLVQVEQPKPTESAQEEQQKPTEPVAEVEKLVEENNQADAGMFPILSFITVIYNDHTMLALLLR
jgi:hypothetical protein